jgi:hypothetical protein
MTKLKCLTDFQMSYIMANQNRSAKELSADLRVDDIKINLFCQANGIELPPSERRRKKLDTFHSIPVERKQRMASKNYHLKMDRV